MPKWSYADMRYIDKLLHECSMSFMEDNLKELEILLKIKIGEGSSRKVYDLKNGYVAKVPLSDKYQTMKYSMQANLVEFAIFRNNIDLPIIPCDLYFFKMIPVIVMEKVDTRWEQLKDIKRPEGSGKFGDGFQGGLTKDGQYLSYDYGYERDILGNGDITKSEFEEFMAGKRDFSFLLQKQLELELSFTP